MALRNLPRRIRFAIVAATSAAMVIAAGLIVWRVLRPSEVVTAATVSYPEASVPVPGKVGALISAPLMVDDRIRIFAKKREVWSDGPPSYHYERSAYWSYRRWPAQVTGVTLVRADLPIVVTAWSDGMLIGIDAQTGKVAWRTKGDQLAAEYTGRRTGADTVYTPPGLFTTGSAIITSSTSSLRSYQGDGTQSWSRPLPVSPECRGTELTTQTQWLVLDTCAKVIKRVDIGSGKDLPSLAAGLMEPVSCVIGHSQCQAMRTGKGWLLTGSDPIESRPLAAPGSALVDGVVITLADDDKAIGHDPVTGQTLWSWQSPAPIKLLAPGTDRVFLLTNDRQLITLNPKKGTEFVWAGINLLHDPEQPYDVQATYTSNRYIVLERTNPGEPAKAKDDTYYFTNRPVLIAIG